MGGTTGGTAGGTAPATSGGLYVRQGVIDQLSHLCLQLGLRDVPLPLQHNDLGLLGFRAPGWSKPVKWATLEAASSRT